MLTLSDHEKDRGWAWVVAFSAFFNQVIINGVSRGFGIVFVELITYYHGSNSASSLIYALSGALSMFLAPLFVVLMDVWSCRIVVVAGGLIASLSLLLASLSQSLVEIIISFGVLFGIGSGCILTSGPIMITWYFSQRRGLAQGIVFTGTGLGAILMPYLVYYLLEEYGLHGTLMLLSGVVLHVVIFATLFRPFTTVPINQKSRNYGSCEFQTPPVTDPDLIEALPPPVLPNPPAPLAAPLPPDETPPLPLIVCCGMTFPQWISRLCYVKNAQTRTWQPIVNISFLTSGQLWFYFIGCSLLLSWLISMVLAPRAVELGLGSKDSAILLSIAGGADTVGRLIAGFLADIKLLNGRRYEILIAFSLLGGIGTLFTWFVKDFTSMALYLTFVVPWLGGTMSLTPLILADMVGDDNMSGAYGICLFVEGFSLLLSPILVGVLADVLGNYQAGFMFIAAAAILASVAFAISCCWLRIFPRAKTFR